MKRVEEPGMITQRNLQLKAAFRTEPFCKIREPKVN